MVQYFEIVLDGYNGATDMTDDHIRWVCAPNIDILNNYIIQNNIKLDPQHPTPIPFDEEFSKEFCGVDDPKLDFRIKE